MSVIGIQNSRPKFRLKKPAGLNKRVIPKLDITRRDLLVFLMVYALYAAQAVSVMQLKIVMGSRSNDLDFLRGNLYVLWRYRVPWLDLEVS
jgi:hypothetical protein